MIIANFTCDKIEWTHLGANGTIPAYNPDNPKKPYICNFDDSRANFILNKFGVRGLVVMNYGDDEEAKKSESLKLWRRFWERQIENQNQHNEQQKEAGNRYSRPTDELDAHAKMLGLDLLRPWRVEAKSSKETEELKGENMALKESMKTLQAQMAEMMKMMIGGGKAGNVQAPPTQSENSQPAKPKDELSKAKNISDEEIKKQGLIAANNNKYRRLGESNMNLWVNKNWDDIMLMPEENKLEIEEKYLSIYGEPFPTERPL